MITVFHHRYSIDGGFTWKPHDFSSAAILARDIVTQPGERLPIFVIYGNANRNRAWTAFYINMTNVMGEQLLSNFYEQCCDFMWVTTGSILHYFNKEQVCSVGRAVSSVGRALDCRAGGRRFKPRPDQHSGS